MPFGTYYKIWVNGTESKESRDFADITKRWEHLAEALEARGGKAILYRRSVFKPLKGFEKCLCNPERWMFLDDMTISPWEILAEIDMG